ncbi:hypothetical protein LPW26_06665 [Rhodopseudomonas sp. HC1]|uniref:hypothetical protein n=1 Tax=Rhodopseudomonas infernalis TaxID=2897386 RepID=UPI001EE937B3|nr:hypothetical protein [Rhodopseudomonas infernalis]MCG6204310.1 hypothetical protein [Rhodopseudomonas infernalis]
MTDPALPQHSARSDRQTIGQIFRMPTVIGVLSSIGLVSALVGDDVWDGVSWLTLGLAIALFAYFLLRPRRMS